MDDDQGQADGDPPMEPFASESPMFVEQDAPSEPGSPESASPEGATISPEVDSAESSQPDEGDEEEAQAEPEQAEGTHSPEDAPAQEQGEDDGGNWNDDNSSDDAEPCTRACVKQAKTAARKLLLAEKRIIAKDKIIEDLRARLRAAKHDISELKKELKKFTGPDSPKKEASWQEMLQECLADKDGGDYRYDKAWKASYRALNMPIDPNMVHPQVRFVEKDDDDDESSSSRQSSPSDLASVRSDEEFRLTKPLPDNVLYQILTELLTKDGLVHCFSRLDPCCRPDELPLRQGLGRSSTGIRGRFFISKEERSYLSLTHDTEDPNTVLAALVVSRKWNFFGVHLFYGGNTFSTSSLGELDRFATGIGSARWSRCQHLELTWVGGKCVNFNLGEPGERWNRRTSPLAWLAEATSLKTLVIHIRESHKGVIRRRYEPYEQKLYMSGKTAGQPNYRMTRSMRNCLGMDFVYQLRGLWWFRAYDLDKENIDPDRSSAKIRDTSFVIDVERVVTQEKVPARAEKSKLEKLDPLFPFREASWEPSRHDFNRVRPIYTEDAGFDNLSNDLDYDTTSSVEQSDYSGSEDGPADDNEDDDNDDDDSSGPSVHSPPGPSRRRRPFTPAPSPGGAEEDDSSGSESDHLPDERQYSVPDDSNHSDSGDSYDEEDASSITTEDFRRRRLHHSDLRRVIVIDEDDDVVEVAAPAPARGSTGLRSLSMFVTPGPDEPRTTFSPDESTRRRSTTALPRRASSAPLIDLTLLESSDEDAMNDENADSEDEDEGGNVQTKDDTMNAANEAGNTVPAQLGTGIKRARLTSPASEGGGDTKRQKSQPSGYRTGSLPLVLRQKWEFPKDA